MRVAAVCDIHGNLPALEAVLEEILCADVDLVVVAGDVVPGPMPREALQTLISFRIPVQFVCGNGETAVLEQLAGREPAAVPAPYRPAIRWNAEQLPEYEELMARWPMTLRAEITGLGEVLFCHATPRNENEVFTRLTPEEPLIPVFAGLDAPIVVCGHTHMQFDRRIGDVRVVNAGSVGMPFGAPGAYWLLLGHDIELRRTTYDLEIAARRIRTTGYPQSDHFADRYVLHPPSESEMLEIFRKAELR